MFFYRWWSYQHLPQPGPWPWGNSDSVKWQKRETWLFKETFSVFCGKLDLKISRHLEKCKSGEKVIEILPKASRNKNSESQKKREHILNSLKNEGDFMYNVDVLKHMKCQRLIKETGLWWWIGYQKYQRLIGTNCWKMPELDGKLLRQKHQESDFNVFTEIDRDMMLSKETKEKRKRKADTKLRNSKINRPVRKQRLWYSGRSKIVCDRYCKHASRRIHYCGISW